MSTQDIEKILDKVIDSSDDVLVAMVITVDGLLVAHRGNVQEPDLFGAYFLELNVVCEKILKELNSTEIEEIFIRSKSGCVSLMPIFEKGYIACMSTPQINSGRFQALAWQAIKRLDELL